MKNVKILDCTLRDGGRIINCAFPNSQIKDIAYRLADANIDIIEVGFLRDAKSVNYQGNSTFFTDVDQIRPFVNRKKDTMYVAFIDYGMFDFSTLKPYDGTSIDGLRIGFTRKNFENDHEEILECLAEVKQKGYKLFVQGVNSLGYTDRELLGIVDIVNQIQPEGFGIVDTYGAMYMDDVDRLYTIVDHNLDENIAIDFHSHNNYQLSFAFAQEIIRLSNGKREVIIDGTLNGMGKCAGNLNTELLVDYLVRKRNYDYDFDAILDIIDDHIYNYHLQHQWGYSIPALMGGIYRSHPNNIIYLTEKFRLATKDIKYIISMIDPDKRMRYDYDNIQRLYQEYNHVKVDDKENLALLQRILKGKKILLLMPGQSISQYKDEILKKIEAENLFVITVNFRDETFDKYSELAFWGSQKRYEHYTDLRKEVTSLITSNIESDMEDDIIVNYDSFVDRTQEYSDNASLMLMRILQRVGVVSYYVAGFDGFTVNGSYYNKTDFSEERFRSQYESINKGVAHQLSMFADSLKHPEDIQFVTPSIYTHIFKR
jgi:4-hydroxy 2-oxovalerate aldolase